MDSQIFLRVLVIILIVIVGVFVARVVCTDGAAEEDARILRDLGRVWIAGTGLALAVIGAYSSPRLQ